MNLFGWETLSLVSTERINESLKANPQTLLLEFEYSDPSCRLIGRFGPWEIVAKGSGQSLLLVDIPIESGLLSLSGGKTLDVAGVGLRVQIPLRMMPNAVDQQVRELRFDASQVATNEGEFGVRCLAVESVLSPLDEQILGGAVAQALAANPEKISYVFAAVGGPAPASVKWLVGNTCVWTQVEHQGQGYLALLGHSQADHEGPANVDPAILKAGPGAAFCFDPDLFMRHEVINHLNHSFIDGARFAMRQDTVYLIDPIALPEQRHSVLFTAHPLLKSVWVSQKNGDLEVVSKGESNMPLGMTLNFTVTNRLKFSFDKQAQTIGFNADGEPQVETHIHLIPVIETVFGWLVRWIASFFTESIQAPLKAMSKSMQSVSRPPPAALAWQGIDEFRLTQARIDGAAILIDAN